jgi:RNA polymerase sigma-70 factor (ECF subfamily)
MSLPTAFAETYVQSYGRLRSVASRLVERQDADDMVQEAYLRALTRGDDFRGESAETTWIHRILVNACLDVRRSRSAAVFTSLLKRATADRTAAGGTG